MNIRPSRLIAGVFCSMVCVLSIFTLADYPGRAAVYVLFTVCLNVLFIMGLSGRKIFFDMFIGIFFWLGFWLKLSLRVAFFGGLYQEPVGRFGGTGPEYDHALFVVSCGVIGLLAASLVRRRFLFSYDGDSRDRRHERTLAAYGRHRTIVLVAFCALFTVVAVTNVLLGIYQRGSVPGTRLPLGLNGVYTWLLLFGLASFSAVLLDCEFRLKRSPYVVTIIAMLECFFSNVSMLSRGLVLNGGSLLIGILENARLRLLNPGSRYKLIVFGVFVALFALSVVAVNHVRSRVFFNVVDPPAASLSEAIEPMARSLRGAKALVIDRWVGIEGAMAVTSYPDLGWDLWRRAWMESYSDRGTSMYDRVILRYEHSEAHLSKHHFINMPGVLAFLYYPGSFPFLLASMFVLGLLAAGIEWYVYRMGGANLVLCSLMGQVVAYRCAHFGYAPGRSYLLFGTIFLNVAIIYLIDRYLGVGARRRLAVDELFPKGTRKPD